MAMVYDILMIMQLDTTSLGDYNIVQYIRETAVRY
jgi:hypothetical protein